MHLVSTRNSKNVVSFEHAVLNCMPEDGGLYVPSDDVDMSRWILYMNKNTTFQSIAGALTTALIKDEFSPLICETIATRAFPFSPKVKRLDDNLYMLELFHGPTGTHKDFGVSYLVHCVDTILRYQNKRSVFVDVTTGEFGASMAVALRGAKKIKAVLVYPKGTMRGLKDSDLIENGGNICAIEVDGTEADCHKIVKELFANRALVEKYSLTVANTANIGRLFPQTFFYPFAFSRIKESVFGDIYYSLDTGNYSNVVAGLYSWKYSLPVRGFIVPANDSLTVDVCGDCQMLDSFVPLDKREKANPADPSNLERLENVFSQWSLLMKSLVFPTHISEDDEEKACKELFMRYGYYADSHTARAYASSKKHDERFSGDGVSVIVARDHPAFDSVSIRHYLGEAPEMSDEIASLFQPFSQEKKPFEIYCAFDAIVDALENISRL
jgi:threonine synthase